MWLKETFPIINTVLEKDKYKEEGYDLWFLLQVEPKYFLPYHPSVPLTLPPLRQHEPLTRGFVPPVSGNHGVSPVNTDRGL